MKIALKLPSSRHRGETVFEKMNHLSQLFSAIEWKNYFRIFVNAFCPQKFTRL